MEVRDETTNQEKIKEDFLSRGYQDKMLQYCIQCDLIVYLPTGAGKTFIATMALKYFSNEVQLPLSEGGKISVFLTNATASVKEKADYIAKRTALRVSVYTDDMNEDAWEREQWIHEFEKHQVIVTTAQIMLEVVRHGFIKVDDFNIMVFDECHHARKGHPMHQLLEIVKIKFKYPYPRVIGLTGMLTPESVSPENVESDIVDLHNIFNSWVAITVTLENYNDVLWNSTYAEEEFLTFEPLKSDFVIEMIEKKVDDIETTIATWPIDRTLETENPLKKLKSFLADFVYQLRDSGLYGSSVAILAVLVELELRKQDSNTDNMNILLRSMITKCEEILHIITNAMNDGDVEDERMETENEKNDEEIDSREKILSYSSPKAQRLLLFLENYAETNDGEIRALISVYRHDTAKCIYHLIQRFAKANPQLNIRPDFIVGHTNAMPESIESILNTKYNAMTLDKFKRNEINVIVASSVLEEGIDLQACNLVMTYDYPHTYRSYIQTKGRARMKTSKYVILTPLNEQSKLMQNVKSWMEVNGILKDRLKYGDIDRELECNFSEALAAYMIPPYETESGAVIDQSATIALLNRYCMSLPADHFTVPTVVWFEYPLTYVDILLPIQSPLKENIRGDFMPNLKIAKRSAAMNACIKLYSAGELDDNFMPIDNRKFIEKFSHIYFKHWKEFPYDKPNTAGTKKNVRAHDIHVPDELINSAPREGQTCYLYVIKVSPGFVHPEDSQNLQIFKTLFESPNTFGILTSKRLPEIATMKFFQTFGLINCSIDSVPSEVKLDLQSLHKLRIFHSILFRDVLEVWKTFFVFDSNDSYVIVPLTNSDINWSTVNQFQHWKNSYKKTQAERSNAVYRTEDWLHKVVCPWYRADQQTRYVVTKVHENLSPQSEFPNNSHSSYADYVLDKYNEGVVQSHQFLIEVKGITTHLDLLNPGQGEDGQKKRIDRGPEFLIPEMCHNFGFPGDLWLKATVLPSILHRLQYLLYAEKIRVNINNYLGLEIVDYHPLPVIDNMNRRPVSNAKFVINNSIIHPNPMETTPKKLEKSDFTSVVKTNKCPWIETDEPVDLERYFDRIYPFEVDYYHKFIHQDFSNLSLDDKNRDVFTIPNVSVRPTLAICDVPPADKIHIKILDLNLNAPVRTGIEQSDLLAAITAASSSDVFDMERFEVIGDAFLKFGVSLYLIQTHTNWHEGHLTTIKGSIVSNRNLCYNAIKMKIPGMIKVHNFNPRDDWQPPMVKLSDFVKNNMIELNASPQLLYRLNVSHEEFFLGEISKDNLFAFFQIFQNDPNSFSVSESVESSMQNFLGKQGVADKTAADTVEAILGVCLKSVGIQRTFKLLQFFNILPGKPMSNNQNISDMLVNKLQSPRIRTNISDKDVDDFLTNYQKLEQNIGYNFKDRAYLLQALTHPSYPTNRITGCYQQLEFLGDAVLDFLVTAYIFERCPEMDPGKLTDLRSALVNNVTLACLCVRYNLHLYILSQNASLTESVARFTEFQAKHNHEVTDHVQLLMEENEATSKMAEYVDVPKTLGDIFEALIGGIFLDTGNDLFVTWQVIYRLMHKELEKFMADVPIQMVRKLYEHPSASPSFDAAVDDGDDVMVACTFTCNGEILLVHGFGTNKYNAKRAAAKLALHKLNMT